MRRSFREAVTTSFLLALAGTELVQADTLCSLPPVTYTKAKAAYPASAFAIEALEEYSIATWYSDRIENGDYAQTAADLVAFCPEDSRISVVIYGLPNCAANELAGSSAVHSASDYVAFLKTLTSAIGNRKVLYNLEPDAIGLLADATGCSQGADYLTHLQTAVDLLSQNKNAEIYLDVGYWSLEQTATSTAVANIVKQLASTKSNVKGITLNTSNYQSTDALATLCSNFQSAVGAIGLHCIFDTSRSYLGRPASNEWCNVKSAGIGALPTSETGINNVDYFIWAKPPGESDGTCDGRTSDSMQGPGAGIFFDELFQSLWNQGIMVAEKGYSAIDGTVRSSKALASNASSSPDQKPQQIDNNEIGQEADNYIAKTPSSNAMLPTVKDGTPSTFTSTSGTQPSDRKKSGAPASVPTSLPAAAPSSASKTSDSQQISTESSTHDTMGVGMIIVVAVVAAVALAVIVGIRHRHKKILAEAKTPVLPALDPLPTTIVNFQPHPTALGQSSNIL